MYRFIALVFAAILLVVNAKADTLPDINDRPWNRATIDPILNSNLVINGLQQLQFQTNYPKKDKDILPCWTKFQPNQYDTPWLRKGEYVHVQSIYYNFSGVETTYNVTLKGQFESDANLKLWAKICTSICDLVPIPLNFKDSNTFIGEMQPGKKLSYSSGFIIWIGDGVKRLNGLRVANTDALDDYQLYNRDRHSVGVCYETKMPIIGSFSYAHLVPIIGLTAICMVFIRVLAWKRATFPLFMVFVFFITNVLGLYILYFGLSNVRLEQGITDRSLIVTLAWYQLIAFLIVAAFYSGVKRLLPDGAHLTYLSQSFRLPTITTLYVFLISLTIWFQISETANYFLTLMSGFKSHASLIRNNLSLNILGIKSHYYHLFFFIIPTLLNLLIILTAFRSRNFSLVTAFVVIHVFVLSLTAEKAPFFWYLLSLFFIFANIFTPKSGTVVFVFSIVVTVICLIFLFGPKWAALFADRALLGSLTVAYTALKIFPDQYNFLNGAGTGFFSIFFTSKPFNLDLFLWRQIFSSSYFSHLTGTATGPVWLQGFANFGIYGLVFSAVIFGLILSFMEYLAYSIQDKIISSGFLAWLVGHYASLGENNLSRYILDFYAIGIIFFIFTYGLTKILFLKKMLNMQAKKL